MRDSRAAQSSDLLLFTDADTAFNPSCARATVALLLRGLTHADSSARATENLQLLSLLSTLTHDRWWERIAQPVAAFELMRHFQLRRVNRAARRRPAFANGQFMLFTRAAYVAIGGHEAVRAELLEDLAFARLVRNAGMRNGVVLADRMLTCRMYDTWPAFRAGWKRIYIEASKRKPARLAAWALRLLITGALLPLASLAALLLGLIRLTAAEADPLAGATAAAGAGAIALWLLAMGMVHRAQRAPLWSTALHPAGAVLAALILREAAADLRRGKGVAWGGKTYVRTVR